ncbi:MAG: DUF4279 domain-containing protein, partial [Stellaceae bacterium]
MTDYDAASTHCHALMQVSGENLDPEGISRLIALKPFSSNKNGEPMARPRPGRPTPLARRGGISYSTYRIVNGPINDHLRYLLNAVLPVSQKLKALVASEHLRWGIVLFIDDAPADWRSLLEESIANT